MLDVDSVHRKRRRHHAFGARRAADNIRRTGLIPAEAARMLAEMSTASAGGWKSGRRWRRLLELALVVGLIASLIGMYARQGRRAEREARALPTVSSGSGEQPGRLEQALDGYEARLARCRKDFEVCLSECRRTTTMESEARCDHRCDRNACAKLRVRARELGPSQGRRRRTRRRDRRV
jgi:hypothetical protein